MKLPTYIVKLNNNIQKMETGAFKRPLKGLSKRPSHIYLRATASSL